MALECELKYLGVDLEALSRRLGREGGECLGRYFEANIVFDYPDRSLKSSGILLRLRRKQGEAVLTVKRPPDTDIPSTLKVYEELETKVGDFELMRTMLETVGLSVAFAYEKVREKWMLDGCAICLDRLPFGEYVEIEGTEESVPACAGKLGIGERETSTSTYHALNLEYRRVNGLQPDESFVFDATARASILREIGEE